MARRLDDLGGQADIHPAVAPHVRECPDCNGRLVQKYSAKTDEVSTRMVDRHHSYCDICRDEAIGWLGGEWKLPPPSEPRVKLEQRFLERCRRLVEEVERVPGVNRPRWFEDQLVTGRRAVETAAHLITRAGASTTFEKLAAANRLDCTLECIVTKEREWDPLFTDNVRRAARVRLEKY
ncbi:MAG: hypothetical protein OXH52_16200 [Gammaproteobacteria bacterium]|nr:hypothetical protein [Gammaproteobacteria bacterium]